MNTLEPKLRTNLDTDLLKLIAIISMLLDHIGGAFFPAVPIFRWIAAGLSAVLLLYDGGPALHP